MDLVFVVVSTALFLMTVFQFTISRSSHRKCCVEEGVFFKISQNLKEHTCVGASLFIELQTLGLMHLTLVKKDSSTDVFKETPPPGDCFLIAQNPLNNQNKK